MDSKTLNVTKLQEETFIQCLFCYGKCQKIVSTSHAQHSTYLCKECLCFVAYYAFWGEKKPFKYSIFNMKDGEPWYKLEIIEKIWYLRSGTGVEMVAWAQGDLIASGSFEESLPPITPGNFKEKLPFLLTFS